MRRYRPWAARLGGVLLLAVAALFFVVMVRDLLRPPPSGTMVIPLLVNANPVMHRLRVETGMVEPLDGEEIRTAYQPAYSPDFQQIAFSSVHHIANSEADIRLYLANVDGTNFRELTQGSRDSDPQWSPDGTRIVFVRSRNFFSALFMVEVATGAEWPLTDFSNDLEPDWSPDGRRIVFTTSRDGFQELYTMSPDGSDLRRLTENENQNDLEAQWSPDGTQITYMTNYSVGDGTGEIWLMKADGRDARPLTANRQDDRQPMWSPNGEYIAFTTTQADRNGSDIFVYDVAADQLRQLTDDPEYEYLPIWSPDSEWIAFTRDRTTAEDGLYLMRVDGSDRRLLLDEAQYRGGYAFVWLP